MAELAQEPESFSLGWCNFEWTPWISFGTTSRTLDAIPDKPGLYRIRPAGQDFLVYIGWAGGSLRECFMGIRQGVTKPVMPKNDPWPVAAALWAWRDAKRYTWEFSATPSGGTPDELEAVVCYLTYLYRQERRESPLCSFGRFHRKYRQSTDEDAKVTGGKLGDKEPLNPAGGPSTSPLTATGQPGDAGWMGLTWSPKRNLKTHTTGFVPAEQGYYIIFDAAGGVILAIRRSGDCAQELFAISRNPWDDKELAYSFYCEPKPLPDHNFRERECDLLGNYIDQFREVPEYQFRDRR